MTGGIATLTVTTLAAGSHSLSASYAGDSEATASSSTPLQPEVQVPSTATRFTVTAPATAAAGTPVNVTVTALDAANSTATGYSGTVHFTSTDGAAVLPADATLVNGVGTFPVTLNTAGTWTVTATDRVTSSITGTSGNLTVSAVHVPLLVPWALAALAAGLAGLGAGRLRRQGGSYEHRPCQGC